MYPSSSMIDLHIHRDNIYNCPHNFSSCSEYYGTITCSYLLYVYFLSRLSLRSIIIHKIKYLKGLICGGGVFSGLLTEDSSGSR